MKPAVLIIGGSYFAGRVLVEEMRKTGDFRLFVLNRGNRPLHLEGVTELRADRHDPEALGRAIPPERWAGVVDFCGYTGRDVDILLSALAPGTAAHYIFISTASVYGNSRSLPLLENSPLLTTPQPELGPAADYGFDKCRAESVVKEKCRAAGMAWTILRPVIIYGRYNYAPRESYFFDRIQNGDTVVIPEKGLALFQFLLVDDLARIIIRCLNAGPARDAIFNAAAPDLVSYARYAEVLEEITAERIPVLPLGIGEIEARRIPLPFPLDSHIIVSGEKLARALDFEYTPFAEGMGRTWQWWQSKRY
ncbi:MAG: NAD-dependent epimerase/dehydratase family protein [Thermodesulfobacteriota bacterium]